MTIEEAREIYKQGLSIYGSDEHLCAYHDARDKLIEAGELPPLEYGKKDQDA